MAARVFEDSLEAEIGILEALMPGDAGYLGSAYPYPSLRATGRVERRAFRLVCLENDLVRIAIAPDLGGRIVKFEDRAGDPLSHGSMQALPHGARGASLPMGLGLALRDGDSPVSLSSAWTVGEEGDDAAVRTCQLAGPLDYSARFLLADGCRELKIEVRAHNRLLEDAPYNGGLFLGGAWQALGGEGGTALLWNETHRLGLAFELSDQAWDVSTDPNLAAMTRLPKGTRFSLGPRQTDLFRFSIAPVAGFQVPPALFPGGAWLVGQDGIEIASSRRLSGWRLIVETGSGTVETTFGLDPAARFCATPAEIGGSPMNAALRTPEGIEYLFAAPAQWKSSGGKLAMAAEADTKHRSAQRAERLLSPLLPSMRFEHSMRSAIASIGANGAGDEADERLEQALFYNAEDPLAWWLKAANRRASGDAPEERPELLNAHYLAPLEPMLRAEGFLSQPQSGQPASAVLKPLLDVPESFVECACLLIEANLLADAMRWIEESLRHIDLPMLRYLMADCALRAGLDADAGAHLAKAANLDFGPPFPWRAVECEGFARLVAKFPNDALLARYAHLVRSIL